MTSFRENRPSRTEIARRLRAPLDEAPATVPFVATLAAMATESTKESAMAPRRGLGLRLAAVAASVVVVTAGASYAAGQLGGGPERVAPVSDTQISDDDQGEDEDEIQPMVVAEQTEIEDDPKPEVDAKRRDNEEGVDEVDDEDVDPLSQDTAPSVATATGAAATGVDTDNDVSQDTATVESADDSADDADSEDDADDEVDGDDDTENDAADTSGGEDDD